MPRRDGTGPMGGGAMTRRGLGLCTGANAVKYGAGLGLGLACSRGFRGDFGRGFAADAKKLLQEKKSLLQIQLEIINKQLENL